MMALALTWITSKHIELYGSVVPKVPDIWGQARLQKHREEFECVMVNDLMNFEVRLNGAVNRADSSFLAQAVALGDAITPAGSKTPLTTPSVNIVSQIPTTAATAPTANAVISTDPASSSLITGTRISIDPKTGQSTAIGLEPTIILEQKARYLTSESIRRTRRRRHGATRQATRST